MSIPIVGRLVSKAKDLLSKIKKNKDVKNNNGNANCNSIPADKVNLSPIAKDMLSCSWQAHGGGSRGRISRV